MNKKKVIFQPFDRNGGIDFFDEEFVCSSEEDFGDGKTSLEELGLDELEILQEEIEEGIADYQLIVDIERESSNRDLDSIKTTNQRIGQLKAELHAVKKEIRRKKKMILMQEVSIAS